MTKILNHINTYQSEADYQNDNSKNFPNVSYIEEDDIVVFDNKVRYEEQYFAIESLEDDNAVMFKLSSSTSSAKTISASTDDGDTWTDYTSTANGTTIATLNMGEKVLIKGNNDYYGSDSTNYAHFTASKEFDVNGNIMSLIYGDNFKEQYSFPTGTTKNLQYLFYNSTNLVSAVNLILPATTLTDYCYNQMFLGCTSLTTAPALPATELRQYCYEYMFQNCTSLTTAPELPATTLVSGCYYHMFENCTSLTTAPELPATTLVSDCYQSMFKGCTSLVNAPELPATTLASGCYSSMFNGCTSLVNAPELSATTLVSNCYAGMFNGCTSLVNAPELSATTLVSNCYRYMFYGCTNLNYIKAMFTIKPTSTYTYNWVSGVASSGTFVKNSAATWDVTGINGIPSGWTVQYASS